MRSADHETESQVPGSLRLSILSPTFWLLLVRASLLAQPTPSSRCVPQKDTEARSRRRPDFLPGNVDAVLPPVSRETRNASTSALIVETIYPQGNGTSVPLDVCAPEQPCDRAVTIKAGIANLWQDSTSRTVPVSGWQTTRTLPPVRALANAVNRRRQQVRAALGQNLSAAGGTINFPRPVIKDLHNGRQPVVIPERHDARPPPPRRRSHRSHPEAPEATYVCWGSPFGFETRLSRPSASTNGGIPTTSRGPRARSRCVAGPPATDACHRSSRRGDNVGGRPRSQNVGVLAVFLHPIPTAPHASTSRENIARAGTEVETWRVVIRLC